MPSAARWVGSGKPYFCVNDVELEVGRVVLDIVEVDLDVVLLEVELDFLEVDEDVVLVELVVKEDCSLALKLAVRTYPSDSVKVKLAELGKLVASDAVLTILQMVQITSSSNSLTSV